MKTISLVTMPGNGRGTRTISAGTTLQAFASAEGLTGRQLMVNGQTIAPAAWAGFDLYGYQGRVEVFALQGSKGNR